MVRDNVCSDCSGSGGSQEDVSGSMFVRQVRKTIARYHLLGPGDRVVAGVSGGVDSMVLLRLLSALREDFGFSLVVAHVNHGLRPDESKREAELVENESSRLGLPFEYGQFDVRSYSRTAGLSLQDAARRVRFRFFKELLLKYGAHRVALGHHADDQVETILLRLFRSSGLTGLKGMLPLREGWVIRPLLETWRREIESFAAERKIPYLDDSSNLRRDYLRNRLRLDLIPLIEKEYQSNFKELVLKSSVILREEDHCLEGEAGKACQNLIREGQGGITFSFSEFRAYPLPLQWRIVKRLLGGIYREEERQEDEAWSAIRPLYEKLRHPAPSFLLELPHGVKVEKRYDEVTVRRGEAMPARPFETELKTPGRTLIEEIGKEVEVEPEPELEAKEIRDRLERENVIVPPFVAFLDYERLHFPLRMRSFRPGDRFQPLGARGEQKLKEFFIDHKIPRRERPGIPLLVSEERIVWVVGYRISEWAKVTEKTERIVRVEVK